MNPYRNFLLICVTVIGLGACSQQEPTVEEKVLMSMFANFAAAQTYDKFCNDGKIVNAPPKEANMYWHGNQQTLVAMMGAPMKRRHPKETVEEGVQRLLKIQNKIVTRAQSLLKEKGCDSQEALQMSKALNMFVKMPPWALHGTIAKEVEKQGGSMTKLTDEENRALPSNETLEPSAP